MFLGVCVSGNKNRTYFFRSTRWSKQQTPQQNGDKCQIANANFSKRKKKLLQASEYKACAFLFLISNLPLPPVSNAGTTAPFQQMLSAVVGKTNGRSLSICWNSSAAKKYCYSSTKQEKGHLNFICNWYSKQNKQTYNLRLYSQYRLCHMYM